MCLVELCSRYFDQALEWTQNEYVILGLLALLTWEYFRILCRRHSRTIQILTTDAGKIQVSRSAFNDLVHTVCAQVRTAGKPSIRLRVRRGRIYLQIRIQLYADQSVNDISVYLQDHITQTLSDSLGGAKIGSVDVYVSGFRRSKQKLLNPKEVAETQNEEE